MNHHLRFATARARTRASTATATVAAACVLAAPFFTSCETTGNRLLSVRESVPPRFVGKPNLIRTQCYFFTAPDGYELLENTKGTHVAGVYSPQDGDRLVEKLKKSRKFDLVTAPSVSSRLGQSGTIEVIREFIYPTEYDPPELPESARSGFVEGDPGVFPVTPATPTRFEKINTGLTAKIKGRIDSKGAITLEFDLKRTTFMGFVNYGSPIMTTASDALGRSVPVVLTENRIEMPVFDTKRVSSRVTLADGHYVAVGGLSAIPQPRLKARVQVPKDAKVEDPDNLFALIKVEAIDAAGRTAPR